MGWIADFLRFWWGLLYWNGRKTWFRANPSRHRCPCQAPSDSGRALETQCEACHSWVKPARFRHVCPLLISTPEGLRCSVNTEDVRPFWRRALLSYLSVSLGGYLLAAILLFSGLRLVGYPVGFMTIAWPGSWDQFHKAKAMFFSNKGYLALSQGQYREGTIALNLSYQLDPSQYATGLTLARFSTLMQPNSCDELFADLMTRHPLQAKSTAEQWLRSALARGKFDVLRSLALDRLKVPGEITVPYFHALLFSTRALGDQQSLGDFAATPEGEIWQRLIRIELILRSDKRQQASKELTLPWFPRQAYFGYYQTRRLLELGQPDDAMTVLTAYQDMMPGTDLAPLLLAVTATRGDKVQLKNQISLLLRRPEEQAAIVEMIATHLVRYPNEEILSLLLEHLRQNDLPKDEASERAYLSVFCAAGVARDREAMREIQTLMKQKLGNTMLSLNAAEEFFTAKSSLLKLGSFLPVFPLSLDFFYALHEHFTLKPNSEQQPAK